MANAFDAVRDLRTPGLVIGTAYIDPQQVPTRIKRATQRMLRKLTATGGWSSKSRKLFEMVMRDHGNTVAWMCDYGAVYNIELTPQAVRDQWCEQLELNYTIEVSKGRFNGASDPNRARRDVEAAVARVRRGESNYTRYSTDMCRLENAVQPLGFEAFHTHMLPEHKAIGEALAARLDGTAPIPVSIRGI